MAMLSKRRWPEETEALRGILREFALDEQVKWAKPCFSFEGKNVAIVQGFNEYIALLFFDGALLKDRKKLLVKVGRQHAPRQMRFRDMGEIRAREEDVRACVAEAVEHARAGHRVDKKERAEREVPVELEAAFRTTVGLKKAFEALTPGRQRFYLFHFAEPKLAATREGRVAKQVPRILAGLGMNDRG